MLDAVLAFPDVHCDDAFAAAAGDAVFVGRRALAEAALRDRQDELLGRPQLDIALLAELDRAATSRPPRRRPPLLRFAACAAPHRVGALEIGARSSALASTWRRIAMRDQLVALAQRDAAHAGRVAALEHAHVVTGKRMHWPSAVVSSTSSFSVQICDVDDGVALVQLHGDLAVAVHLRRSRTACCAARRPRLVANIMSSCVPGLPRPPAAA